jgi:hypothetical protein
MPEIGTSDHRPQATAPVLDSTFQDMDMMSEPVE